MADLRPGNRFRIVGETICMFPQGADWPVELDLSEACNTLNDLDVGMAKGLVAIGQALEALRDPFLNDVDEVVALLEKATQNA